MFKTTQLLFTTLFFFGFVLIPGSIKAQPTIKIVVDPDIQTIYIGKNPSEIILTAQTERQDLEFMWSIVGPGKLEGDVESPGVLYIAPTEIAEASAQTVITVTVIDSSRRKATDAMIFTLHASVVKESISVLLETGDSYFAKRWFTTGPDGKNAFDKYKAVLKIDPGNQHACEKIRKIMKFYKDRGDSAYKQTNYSGAKTFYRRYWVVTEYMLNTLRDQSVKSEFQEVQKRLEELQNLILTPMPTQKPTITPTGSSLPDEERIFQVEQMLSQNTARYEALKTKELEEGQHINDQIIPVLTDIIKNLDEMEHIWKQLQKNPKVLHTEMEQIISEKLDSISHARTIFENELSKRQ